MSCINLFFFIKKRKGEKGFFFILGNFVMRESRLIISYKQLFPITRRLLHMFLFDGSLWYSVASSANFQVFTIQRNNTLKTLSLFLPRLLNLIAKVVVISSIH
jgi:hypothetical protein